MKPIRNEKDYQLALENIEQLMVTTTPLSDSDQDRLEVLAILVEVYESTHYLLPLPDPVEAIKFYMEHKNLTPKDLTSIFGRTNRLYEILNRTRPLTLTMIRKLHDQLHIPLESLIKTTTTAA